MFAEAIREWAIGPRCLYKLRSLLLATRSYACVLKCIRAKETTHDHWAVFYMFHACLYWKMRDFTIAHISFLSKERLIFHHRNLMLCLNSAGAVLLVWGLQLLMFLLLLLILTLTSFIPGTESKSKGISDLLSARTPTSSSYHCVWLVSQELHVCLEVEVPQHLSLFVFNYLSCCLPAF